MSYLSELSCHDIFTFLAQKKNLILLLCLLVCCSVAWFCTIYCTSLSLSPCPRSHHMLQVLNRHTLGTRTPSPTICHPHTSSMCVRTEGYACSGFRSGLHPCGHWAFCPLHVSGESVCTCVHSCYPPSMCSHTRICITLPREELWAVPRKAFGNWFGKTSGNVCAKLSDGFVSIMTGFGPGAMTEDQNREFSTKEQQIQCRKSPTNPLLK